MFCSTDASKSRAKEIWRESFRSDDKKLRQLNDRAMEGKPVIEPIDADILTTDD